MTVQSDSRAALDLISRADRIFRLGTGDLTEALEMRKRFVEGYRWLCAHDPERLARVTSRIPRTRSERTGASKATPARIRNFCAASSPSMSSDGSASANPSFCASASAAAKVHFSSVMRVRM